MIAPYSFSLIFLLPYTLSSPVQKSEVPDTHAQSQEDQTLLKYAHLEDPRDIGPNVNYLPNIVYWQMLWRHCPVQYVNCLRCSSDGRCHQPSLPRPAPTLHIPYSDEGTRSWKDISQVDPSEPQALTGPQLAHTGPTRTVPVCMLKHCENYKNSLCDPSTIYLDSRLTCQRNVVLTNGEVEIVRAWTYSRAPRVSVDAAMVCYLPFQEMLCSNTVGSNKCFVEMQGIETESGRNGSCGGRQDHMGNEAGSQVQQELEIQGTEGHGVIQIPSADARRF
jgi:hypothetical protein